MPSPDGNEPRCPACGAVRSYPQRFCAACGRWLDDARTESVALPLPPMAGGPPSICSRCQYPAPYGAVFCANCGQRVVALPPPPPPPKPRRQYEWLPYVMFPLMLAIQVGLLVLLWVTARGHISGGRVVFVVFIGATGIANIFAGINVIGMLLKERARTRRNLARKAGDSKG